MTNFETEINERGYIAYTNEGDSMMPLLRQHRDIMVIRKITSPLQKNDAVLFKRPTGQYVLHRIVKVCKNGQYRIVGDNRAFPETVPEEWIIGILTEIIRDGEHLSVESDEYKAYLKTVPRHRFRLKLKAFPRRVLGKMKRICRKVKKPEKTT